MNLSQRSMKRAAQVLLAAAVVAPAAQAAQVGGRAGASSSGRPVAGYSPQELTAIANSHPYVSSSHLKELMATADSQLQVLGLRAGSVESPNQLALQELRAIANSHPSVGSSHLKELIATAGGLR